MNETLIPETFYKDLLDNLTEGVYFVDRDRQITYWNHGAEMISGYQQDFVLGKRCMDNILVHINDQGKSLCHGDCPIVKTINGNCVQEAEVFLHHKDGHRVPVIVRTAPIRGKNGEIIGAVETFSDISKIVSERKRSSLLEDIAEKDDLTKIPNRYFLNMKLENFLNEFRDYKNGFGLLFIDIDNFKLLNDTFGHQVGDEVLIMVARTLASNLRSSDLIGRWGGEEFLGLFENADEQNLAVVAEKLRILVENSHTDINGRKVHATISIGGTIVRNNDTVESIVKRADALMYQCKSNGKNQVLIA